ncbi:transcriptional regulator with XRE-family HTH domain, partial [Staphylococcus caledonicus]
MQIGSKLRNLRRQKNLTQEELAERTDLSKGYISQIESQHASPSMETFLNIFNCQIKCNTLSLKSSAGVFQSNRLRGRVF